MTPCATHRRPHAAGRHARRPLSALAALGVAAVLAGCATSAPPDWHSVLPPAAGPTAPAAAAGGGPGMATPPAPAATDQPVAAAGVTLAVGRISVPQAVDRTPLVVTGAGGLTVLDGQRWIEPVKAQLPRAMALLLAERLPGATVTAWPADAGGRPRWRLSADVQRFELATAPARAQLRVVWTLRPAEGDALPEPRVFDVTVPATEGGDGTQALVAAMRDAVARWADAVARAAQAAGSTAPRPAQAG